MKTVLVLLCVLSCAGYCAEVKLPPNAALQYWQAFSFMSDIPKEDRNLMGLAWDKIPADKRPLFAQKLHVVMNFLKRGAQISQCDWGIDMKRDGPGTLMPHLGKCREIARAGCLVARNHFENGRHKESVDLIFEVLTLARHTSSGDGSLISKLVEVAISSIAIDALARQIPQLPPVELAQIEQRFKALPEGLPFTQTMRGERQMAHYIKRFFEDPKVRQEAGKEVVDQFKEFEQLLGTPAAREEQFKMLDAFYTEVEAALALPYVEFEAAMKAIEPRIKNAGELAQLLWPAMTRSRQSVEILNIQIAMTHAATQIVLKGEGALAQIPDPHGKGPFTMKKLANGFELVSEFKKADGSQVSLSFGIAPVKPQSAVKPPAPPAAVQQKAAGEF
ncbi:MAG TPA: hypothetical protein VEK08_23565 [Planctomycetota bacterium]|nr:hypothetical protein [Planctomycetota bacterium]